MFFNKSIRDRVIERINKKIELAEKALAEGTDKLKKDCRHAIALAKDKRDAGIEVLAKELVDNIIK